MVTYFNKKDMLSFGEYLLSDERKQSIIDHPNASMMPPVEERLKMVHHADFENWLDSIGKKIPDNQLKSEE
jgi:hypothetical protein